MILTGYKVLIFGGDNRHLEIARLLSERDATVVLAGYGNLRTPLPGTMFLETEAITQESFHALVLPAKGADDAGVVDALFDAQKLILDDALLKRLAVRIIFTGIAGTYLKALAERNGVRLIPLFDRDDVAILNAIPTVEGALALTIQHTDFTLHGAKTVVLGFGRVGMTLARTLHAIGSDVAVGARSPENLARATEMRLNPFHLADLKDRVREADLLYNTIPHPIVTAEVIARMKQTAFILDLASAPGGTEFRFAEKRGIKAILAPSLPGLVAPKTAGRIMADVIGQVLLDELPLENLS